MSFDFDAAVVAPFRMQPGLRRLAPGAPHLTPCRPGSRHQREKLAVLSAFAHQALVMRPGFDPAPPLACLAAHAAAEHPGHFRWDGQVATSLGVQVTADGRAVLDAHAGAFGLGDEIGRCLRGLSPVWRLAGLICLAFEEDFALLNGSDGTVPWLAVALPSHWAPEEKVGLHFRGVHAPVADNELLMAAGERLPVLVCQGPAHERFVWSLGTHPRLHAHPLRTQRMPWPVGDPASVAHAAWWRTERQTFLPLPERACGAPMAIFTIGIQVTPLVRALEGPGQAQRLHAALASMSPAVLDYRGLTDARDDLLAWLAQRASA